MTIKENNPSNIQNKELLELTHISPRPKSKETSDNKIKELFRLFLCNLNNDIDCRESFVFVTEI